MPQVKDTKDSIAVYTAKILFAILMLLAFFTMYLVILGRDSQSYDGGTRKLRATPTSTSFFLSNGYQSGAQPFEIEGEAGSFLGTDRGSSVLAVNMRYQEDGSVDAKSLLQVFDIGTKQRRLEISAAGCSNVSINNLVYCFNDEEGSIHGINVLNGKKMTDFPAPTGAAGAAEARLLGSQQQADIVQVTAKKEGETLA